MNAAFFLAGVEWVVILGLLTIGGYLRLAGTFGRWAAPYTLSAMIGIIMVYTTGQTMLVINYFIFRQLP